jgi:hypothetical protein
MPNRPPALYCDEDVSVVLAAMLARGFPVSTARDAPAPRYGLSLEPASHALRISSSLGNLQRSPIRWPASMCLRIGWDLSDTRGSPTSAFSRPVALAAEACLGQTSGRHDDEVSKPHEFAVTSRGQTLVSLYRRWLATGTIAVLVALPHSIWRSATGGSASSRSPRLLLACARERSLDGVARRR